MSHYIRDAKFAFRFRHINIYHLTQYNFIFQSFWPWYSHPNTDLDTLICSPSKLQKMFIFHPSGLTWTSRIRTFQLYPVWSRYGHIFLTCSTLPIEPALGEAGVQRMAAYSKYLLIGVPVAVLASCAVLWLREKQRRRSFKEVGRVSGLFVYPVKSCKGIRVRDIKCFKEGMEYDR